MISYKNKGESILKKKILNLFTLICLALFSIFQTAHAVIMSEADITFKMNQVQSIANYDFYSMINKNELIGEMRSAFNMSTMQYRNNANMTVESLRNILSQIDIIKNSSDFSDSDKNLQLSKLYQDADRALYDLDAKTINYLFDAQRVMPTITYQRYVKKFLQQYNDMNLTDSKLYINY